jgi:nucleotide-binding universal stress UspA family protein
MPKVTVLVPLDTSQPAELALSFIQALRPLGELRVRLLSVVESNLDLPAEVEKRREVDLAAYLDYVGEKVESSYGLATERVRRIGLPHVEILDEAAQSDVNLLLMSTHGRTMAGNERLGSVADKVVRGASCPVLLVGPHASVPLRIERITVPLDGSRLAAEALPVARTLADRLGSSLRLVRAVQYPLSVESDSTGSLAAEVVDSLERTAALYLSEAKLELETGRPVETAVLRGAPSEALLSDLRENRPDLLVMTSHGRTGFIKWALGSITDKLIRGPVPVLVLKPAEEVGRRLEPLSGERS